MPEHFAIFAQSSNCVPDSNKDNYQEHYSLDIFKNEILYPF